MTPRTTWILVAVLLAAGCKSSGGGGAKSAGLMSRGDPLLGARIPPQNLPTSGKDAYTSRERRDPLYGIPSTAEDKPRDEKVSKPLNEKGNATSSLPRNTKDDPFRRGVTTTPAALAGRIEPDDSTLSIGDRRPTVIPAGAVRDGSFDAVAAELRKLGAKVGEPEREKGRFVVRCEVPIDADDPGRLRWYEGAGSTPAAAAKQLLEQVTADRR
jgi:hypothetical protein